MSINERKDPSYSFSTANALRVLNEFESGIAASPPPSSGSGGRCPRNVDSPTYGQLTPRETRVSFNENGRTTIREEVGDAVMEQRKSRVLFRAKTKSKSRLLDDPPEDQRSQKQRVDEDDPFLDDDFPEEYYKKMKFSKWSIFQTVSFIIVIAALSCTLAIRMLRNRTLFELHLWKWEIMVLVLISGRLVSGWVIRIIVFFIERNFIWRKRVLYFVYGIRNAVQNCIWLGLVLISWQCIFNKKVERITNGEVLPYVTRILICLLVGTLIWLLKTLLVKVLASSFHVSRFFDRIHDSLFNQYVIETLSGPPLIKLRQENEECDRLMSEVRKLQDAGADVPADLIKANVFQTKREDGVTVDHLQRLNQMNVSAWNMKRLMSMVKKGVLSTMDETIQDSLDHDNGSGVLHITSECQAKAAAKKIFFNVAMVRSRFIYLEDLMRFMREEEAMKTMKLIEGSNESKGISKSTLKNWVVNSFRERRALALSLNDTKTAVNKLHRMLDVVIVVIMLVIWLLILKLATTQFFIFLGSQLLLVAFMFGNTLKTTFEAIIFLFVMHPFDVGDRCEIDQVQMVVEEMNILTTVFLRYDNQKITYPNSVLATKPISNYYRSPDMGDAIDFCIHVATPFEKITLMKEKITRYVDNKSEHWCPSPMIVLRDVEDMNRLKVSVWLSHRINFQDMGERWARRALLVEEMIKVFRDLQIEYRMLPLDVNVRNLPPLTSTRLPSNWSTLNQS
ncbi:mechanosensitive ion channel protein 5-like [Impatiens glandulifera]|uniref:mechanosensitive ion channel protein 5-like n=1 Tax=Impatiens glandulifera TaxID=253017 RepID=UPI001FB09022|nr:mechanosensitive ion channel protein 5-like [Impatiens glandulifera]